MKGEPLPRSHLPDAPLRPRVTETGFSPSGEALCGFRPCISHVVVIYTFYEKDHHDSLG